MAMSLACAGQVGCGDGVQQVEPAPEQAADESEPERETAIDEEAIANGIAKQLRVWVRYDPREDARAVGLLRWGQRFSISERREVESETWYRMSGVGWIRDDGNINVRTNGPAGLAFIPKPPKNQGMPYRYVRVTAGDGVPVYRRPPRRGERPERVRTRDLQEGYIFTVDKWVNIYDRKLYRTTRYWFVPREGTTPVRGTEFEGFEVSQDGDLPFLWVTDPTAKTCDTPIDPGAEDMPTCEPVKRHLRLPLRGVHERAGRWYQTELEAGETRWIAALQVSRIHAIKRPSSIEPGQRWIHVSLRNQFVALYEGDAMVYVTLASTGEEEHPTPTGTFAVRSKHITATMDDEDNLSGPYYIQDVPWVLYFKGGYALHGAFWHDRFGLKTSHGCVNLAPNDAKRVFEFATEPPLPEGLHAVFTKPEQQGTAVHITGS